MRRGRAVGFLLVAFVAYQILGMAAYGTASSGTMFGTKDDPSSYVWFLRWWPWALLHGVDPTTSHLVWAPRGYSMGWATSIPTISLLLAPVTLIAGPVVAYNAAMMLAPSLAATAAAALAFALTADRAAAFVAGLVYGFSAYETAQLIGHLNLAFTAPLPLAVLVLALWGGGRIGWGWALGLLWLALLAWFGVSTELFATSVAFGLLSVAAGAAVLPARSRGRAFGAIGLLVGACGLVMLTASPLLLSMERHRGDIPDFVNPPQMYSTDLANLVLPTVAEWLRLGHDAVRLSFRFTGNLSEQGGCLGVPLLVVLGVAVRRGWRKIAVRIAVVAGVMLIVASLGPRLQVGGRVTGVALPWTMVAHLPLLRGALPCRLMLGVSLAASVLVASWVAGSGTRGARWRRSVVALAALVPLVPNPALRPRAPAATPGFFTHLPASVRGANLLVLPLGSGETMLWQARADMGFAQAGGRLSFVPLFAQRWPVVWPLISNVPAPDFGDALARWCRASGVRLIVAGPGTSAAVRSALDGLGWQRRETGGVTLIALPLG